MKYLLLLATLFISSNLLACQLVPQYEQELLQFDGRTYGPFWGQEYVGVDLVKEEMRLEDEPQKVATVVLDTGFFAQHINLSTSSDPIIQPGLHYHGTCVANIINGKGPYGASEQVDYLALINNKIDYHAVFQALIEQGKVPKLISNSMKWSLDYGSLADQMEELGAIWVVSAGNDYPQPLAPFKDSANVIRVGNLRPDAFQNLSSQESPNLTILAPANNQLASIDDRGAHRQFGGTSAAAPLVSGSIANALALLPGLNQKQVITLLQKSALTTANQLIMKEQNPAGLLNSYRLFRVAKKIAQTCQHHLNCINQMIEQDESYHNFQNDINYNAIKRSFPECFIHLKKEEISCQQKQMQFKQLRKLALLFPHKKKFWRKLSCIASRYGLSGNANFYRTMGELHSQNSITTIFSNILSDGDYPHMQDFRELQYLEDL